MEIKSVRLYHVVMKLREGFETSFGKTIDRHCVLIAVEDVSGETGWGEAPVDDGPWYSWETVYTTLYVYREFIIPILEKNPVIDHPSMFLERVKRIRGYRIAKAGFEYALWDLYAKLLKQPLYRVIGGVRDEIESGVSIGVIGDMDRLLRLVNQYLDRGYRRIKIKVKRGWDLNPVRRIREEFGDIPLQVDANADYTLQDLDVLRELDKYSLLMIEQPLGYEDLAEHAILQSWLETPICLDESIRGVHDVMAAHRLGSCRIINVKPPRVGGLCETVRINRVTERVGIPIWIGGMLETGVGRGHLVAAATLSNVKYPCDISASSRYYEEDVVEPEWTVQNGIIRAPRRPGIGVEVVEERVMKYALSTLRLR